MNKDGCLDALSFEVKKLCSDANRFRMHLVSINLRYFDDGE